MFSAVIPFQVPHDASKLLQGCFEVLHDILGYDIRVWEVL